MPGFRYIVLQGGIRREGTLEAASEREAAERLRADGASVLSLAPAPAGHTGSGKSKFLERLLDRITIRSSSVELVLRQLGSLLRSGVPILTALTALARTAPPPMQKALRHTAERIREGKSFSKALAENLPGIDRVTIGLLGVGEANGTLDTMAVHAAGLKERARKTREQILQAFSYPTVVLVAAMGIGAFMVRKVFPAVMKFIESSRKGVELPLPTRMVIALDGFLTEYGLYVLLAPVVLVVLVVALRRTARSGEWVDAIALRVPLLGGVLRFHANAMWCSTMGSLLGSGLDVLAAVDLVRGTMSNWIYAAQFERVRAMLRDGSSLSKSIEATELYRLTPMAHTLVSVSEEGGHMDESLLEVGRFSEDQLTRRVTLLSKLVEPAVFVVVGGFVGLVYFGFYLAVLTATRAAR
ncbi:type II secretion system F family protein [Kiritimatiella glycovorans]|uniref:Type IV fimbrial assembly protein PilC n=1 Tax=Kiritimatiella glycovorans TaxID=1307763 RepID=A0A0G3EL31_9BACT|nr:type II secretion system F family protein [Kiritimatiella glycovorans]AKJ64834.1 Type IV fimbrial assembly protein PilC [Kiritimatiella glycovorans]